jgi:hypothetical protein
MVSTKKEKYFDHHGYHDKPKKVVLHKVPENSASKYFTLFVCELE